MHQNPKYIVWPHRVWRIQSASIPNTSTVLVTGERKPNQRLKRCDFRNDRNDKNSLNSSLPVSVCVCGFDAVCTGVDVGTRAGFPLCVCALLIGSCPTVWAGEEDPWSRTTILIVLPILHPYCIVSSLFSPANQYLFVSISVHWRITQVKCFFVLLSVKPKVWLRLFLIWHSEMNFLSV